MLRKRKLNRLKHFDYSRDALYFVTSCVQGGACVFGEIKKGKMILNTYGQIANDQWYWLASRYRYVILHEFVVMPNHIHGIIEISRDFMLQNSGTLQNAPDPSVRTGRDLSVQRDQLVPRDLPQPQSSKANLKPDKIKSLSELMGAYKTTSSKQIRLAGLTDFAWKRSFHDHIIRNRKAYLNISNYILNNPSKWEKDRFFD